MQRKLIMLIFATLLASGLFAQVTVSGSVFINDEFGIAVPGFPVILNGLMNGVDFTLDTETDEEGRYEFGFDAAVLPAATDWTLATFDPCTGEEVAVVFGVSPNAIEYTVDLVICSGINPPPPPDTCVAFFEYQQLDERTFQFASVVGDFIEVDSLHWNFGDGTLSTELVPVHTFTENGLYTVVLSLFSGDCVATAAQVLFVFDPTDCACDDVYQPVCTFGPNGSIITFSNACEAQCSGYLFNQLFDCSDQDCVCPTFVAPVCVIDPATGDSLTFSNHCFAECEGFGPDQWIDCVVVPDPDGCGCELLPTETVCVSIFGQTIEFRNLCEVECYGFLEFPIAECGTSCVCTEEYAPVCVIDSTTGLVFTFSNSCYAECAGYGVDQQYACGPDVLDCTIYPFPVCAYDTTGSDSLIYFPTLCGAIDAGYQIDQLVDCGFEPGCSVVIDYTYLTDDRLTLQFEAFLSDTIAITEYFWDFGDGTVSTDPSPSHTYATEGHYVVTLTVSGSDCTATTLLDISVGEGNFTDFGCQAFFFFEQPDTNNLLTYQFINFTDFGQDNDVEVNWDFGDGTTSTELNPLHTFASAGSYTVTLTVSNGQECQSSLGIAINAGENVWYGDLDCRAWFLPIIIADSNFVYFANWSSFDAVEFFWDLGDGTLSNDFEVAHQYADAGTYTVTLTTTSSTGCVNTYSVTIDIAGNNFTSNPSFRVLSSTDEAGTVTPPTIEAFPNPTRDVVTVRWENGTSGRYDWSLVNMAGQRLLTGTGNGTGATGQFDLDLANQAPGIYLLQLRTPEGLQVLRLSKVD